MTEKPNTDKSEKTVKKAESPTLIDLKAGINRAGPCVVCGRHLPVTTPAVWNKDTDELYCYDCRQNAKGDKAFLYWHHKIRGQKRLSALLTVDNNEKTKEHDRICLSIKEAQIELEASHAFLRFDEFLRNKQEKSAEELKVFLDKMMKDYHTFDDICSYADMIRQYDAFWPRKRKKKVAQEQEQEVR